MTVVLGGFSGKVFVCGRSCSGVYDLCSLCCVVMVCVMIAFGKVCDCGSI